MEKNIPILIAFAAYMVLMLVIGALYYKKTKNASDYFLGGRQLNGWVAALSAQASDMSGWLLMGLPGAIFALGTGQIWIAVGLAIGTILNWIFVASRLRRYTIVANDSLTLPEYFENRFHDKSKVLRVASSIFILIFFLVYTASGFSAGAKLFNIVFDVPYTTALIIGAVVILAYTFLGGFMAVCWTDFIQGLLMIVAIIIVPVAAIGLIGGWADTSEILRAISPDFLNPVVNDGKPIGFIEMISQLGWALGYFGMPHILVRFMAIRSPKEVKKSRWVACTWCVFSLLAACFLGIVGRAYMTKFTPDVLATFDCENIFIKLIQLVFSEKFGLPFVGGLLLCGILAAIMSTADSQLLVTSSSVSEDLYKGVINKNASDRSMLLISRICVFVVAAIAFFIALDPNSSVMGLVSNAWAGFGAAFGPVVLLSLFWRRCNLPGAAAGMISGGLCVIVWDYLGVFGGQTLGALTGLYSLIPGFVLGLIAIVVVSLLTKAPSQEILDEFDLVASKKEINPAEK